MGEVRLPRHPRNSHAPGVWGLCAAFALQACVASMMVLFGAEAQAADELAPPVGAPSEATKPAPASAQVPDQSGPQSTEAADGNPAVPKPERDVQIEQKHVGRRVSEVIVTPAGFTYHYTMDHLDDQEPGTVLQPHPQLSVPRFFRIDF
ncbi:MAG: hypothetical protein JO133_05295 [Burkholderiaceae bacterium]|nr:hypothetical protein [Burkholderiaceae bacterium]